MVPLFLVLLSLLGALAFAISVLAALHSYSFSRLQKYQNGNQSDFPRRLRTFGPATQVAVAAWALVLLAALVLTGLGAAPFEGEKWRLVVAPFVGVAVVVWFAWSIGTVLAEPLLCRLWPLLEAIRWSMAPLLWLVQATDRLLRFVTGRPDRALAGEIEEEILSVVNEGEREGVILGDEADMIEGLFALRRVKVSEIMTPRTDMVMLRANDTLEQARQTIAQHGYSRIPVYAENRDEIRGVLYAKDLLGHLGARAEPPRDLADVKLRAAVYVPENKPVDDLLRQFKKERIHIAIVLDEYGGVAGLVTIEDVLEEIVGEIIDEFDPDELPPIQRVSESVLEVDARVHVDELNEQLAVGLPEDADYDTVGGFVFSTLGHIPKQGESVQHGAATFTVLEATDRTIHRIRVEVQADDAQVNAADAG